MLYVNSCCCTCLSQINLQSIHNKDNENIEILEKLANCILEKDSIFDCAPLLICEKCFKIVDEFYKFKKMSLRNLDLFRNCLKQLISNPFSGLSINGSHADKQQQEPVATRSNNSESNQNQSRATTSEARPAGMETRQSVYVAMQTRAAAMETGMDTPQQASTSQDYAPFVKIERETVENQQEEELEQSDQQMNSADTLKINSVESLLKTRNPLAKKRTAPPAKRRSCYPCGKHFVRNDFYLRHILNCNKNDDATKNNVLRWAENRNINIRGQAVGLLETLEKPKIKPVPNVRKSRKRGKMPRSSCRNCKKKITTAFLGRHHIKCKPDIKVKEQNIKDLKLKEQMSSDSDTSDTSTDDDINNTL